MPNYYYPPGLILPFDQSCPTGWTEVTDWREKFPKGASTYGATGGSEVHKHTVDDPTIDTDIGGTKGTKNCIGGGPKDYANSGHVHSYNRASVDSSNTGNLPPYIYVVFCKKS